MAFYAILQISLTVLFLAVGVFATAAIISTWRTALPAIAALGREIALLENDRQPRRTMRFCIAETARSAPIPAPAPARRVQVAYVRKLSGALMPATGLRAAA